MVVYTSLSLFFLGMVDPIPSPTLFPSYPNKILLNHHFSWLNHHVHPFSYDFPMAKFPFPWTQRLSAFSSSVAMDTMAALPVKSSVPDKTVMKRPKGKPKAPKINLKPGGPNGYLVGLSLSLSLPPSPSGLFNGYIIYIYSHRQNYGKKKTFQFTGAACL